VSQIARFRAGALEYSPHFRDSEAKPMHDVAVTEIDDQQPAARRGAVGFHCRIDRQFTEIRMPREYYGDTTGLHPWNETR